MNYRFFLAVICLLGLLKPLRAAAVLGPIEARLLRDKIVFNYSEEDIIDRLKSMYSIVDVTLDQDVIDQVKRFVLSDRTFSKRILHRLQLYFPLIERTLQESNLPGDLKYIAAIESGLNPAARSGVGAAGLWQFMPATARNRGLRVDDKLDQRFDPVTATKAAASYFSSLYQMFGDWTLVLAAYNCGENKVLDAIEKSGSKNFWEVRKFLPRQTQLFVPSYIGLSYMIRYSELHNLYPDSSPENKDLLTFIKIDKELNVEKMLKATKIDRALFKSLNPGLRKSIMPKSVKGHYLTLPDSLAVSFVDYYSKIKSQNKTPEETNVKLLPGGIIELISFSRPQVQSPEPVEVPTVEPIAYNGMDYTDIQSLPSLKADSPKNYILHIVRTKESLSDIADQYENVSVADLMAWNQIEPDAQHIRKGSVLRIRQ